MTNQNIQTNIPGCTLRFAHEQDNALVFSFIRKIAEYEKMSNDVVTTEEMLYDSLFVRRAAQVVLAEYEGKPVGFALFFHNFSTFTGRQGLYLEDVFVDPGMRGKGIGKVLLTFLARVAVERGCGRMEWTCLNWNKPSIAFYEKLGAKAMSDWSVYRLEGETLQKAAGLFTSQ